MSHLGPVTHVLPLATIRRDRRLPFPGAIGVRIQEKVQAMDVLGESEGAPEHVYLDIARGLGVSAAEVGRWIVKQVGEPVEPGEVIAGPVGWPRRAVRAPAAGRIAALRGGRVLLRVIREPVTLRAGVPGVVVGSDGVQTVTVETVGALIQCVWGNGRQDFGVMRLVGQSAGARLQADHLDIDLRGAVLVAGVCDHPAPLQQATDLSVRGVILGGMSSDLIPTARRLPYPIVLTEGFGKRPMNTPAFTLLETNAGREVAVDGRPAVPYQVDRPEVIIPLPASRHTDPPIDVIAVERGIRVRVVRPPYLGETGVVQEILPRAVDYPSGILARSAAVDLEDIGVRSVPLANLEVLQ
jgi:hypothetical protein